jgi:hypothetical protein
MEVLLAEECKVLQVDDAVAVEVVLRGVGLLERSAQT